MICVTTTHETGVVDLHLRGSIMIRGILLCHRTTGKITHIYVKPAQKPQLLKIACAGYKKVVCLYVYTKRRLKR